MQNSKRFSPASRLRSFTFAISGLRELFKSEHNSLIHLAAAAGVLIAGIFAQLNRWQWSALVFAVALVFMAELFNTAVEQLCNTVKPEQNEGIRRTKDLSAAAVLVAAITAVITGIIVFTGAL